MLESHKAANLFTRKLTEMKDMPLLHKLGIYSSGSLIAEDDYVKGRDTYSCSLKCVSEKGKLYFVSFDMLSFLQNQPCAWDYIMEQAIAKESKKLGHNIKTKPIKPVAETTAVIQKK